MQIHQLVSRYKEGTIPEIRKDFVARTKAELERLQTSGEGSEIYERYVDGVEGAPEESVNVPGVIQYNFHWMSEIVTFAIAFMRKRWPAIGPGRGGHWRDSFLLVANGSLVDISAVDNYESVILTNKQPYSRKAQVGFKGFEASKGMFDDCVSALKFEFGARNYRFRVNYYMLEGGYVLKRSRKTTSSGRSLGEPMRYPSITIGRRQ